MCYDREMDGGTTELDSIWGQDEPSDLQPPSDEALEAISKAVHEPHFMRQLVVYILRHAHGNERAQFLGFTMGNDLPGGMCAESLARTLLERILLGKRPWDMERYPDFLIFCKMHARSMVSNLFDLRDTVRRRSVSPVEEEGEDKPTYNEITGHSSDKEEGNAVRGREEFNQIAKGFLEEFALNLPDDSTEQKIIMAVIDNADSVKEPRDGSNELLVFDRPYMIDKLKISGKEFDAGLKRLQRQHKDFLPKWLAEKKLTTKEIGGLLYGR
jgi:hypothetical protein